MTEKDISIAYKSKRVFFDNGNTTSYDFRIAQLKKLKKGLKKFENAFLEALYIDMHKPRFEAFTSEIGVVYEEINYAIKHLSSWMEPTSTSTPIVMQPANSMVYNCPLGVVLIIGPWNYPIQLLLAPLVGAIAAGNCAIIKPSEITIKTAEVMEALIQDCFSIDYISVIQGQGEVVCPLLIEQCAFDHIFFTGSVPVGKIIMNLASKHLTPVTLELGGKSPVIVDKKVNIKVAAKRIAWAKFFNAGQTCIAPDYLLIHEDVKAAFIEHFIAFTKLFYGDDPLQSESFAHIVTERRCNVLISLLNDCNIIMGGQHDITKKYVAPTLVDGIDESHPLMKEEIFGPILPIITWKSYDDILKIVRKNRHPLALYLYSKDSNTEKFVIENIEFGGGGINCSLIHLTNPSLPFGGVGSSGIGGYHGKYSFDCMSHKKAIVKAATWIDPSIRYAPYNKNQLLLIKKFYK